jgi:diguanylate cyclase (GGDEF)-like protein
MSHLGWNARRTAEPIRGSRTAAILIVLFTALAVATRLFCLDPNQSTAFWPANGALVAAMLILPRRPCILAIGSCFTINIAVNMLTSYSSFDSTAYATLNIFTSYLVALQTRRLCGATTDLTRFRRLATFGAIAFLSAAFEAIIGEAIDSDHLSTAATLSDWLQWTMCDGFGFLLGTPAILLALKNSRRAYLCEAGRIERWSLLMTTSGLTLVSFLFTHSPVFLLIYPLLILTAFRAGPPWVLASILITALISSGLTAHGFGPFAALSSSSILPGQGMIQSFLITIFLAAVPANNALGEKSRASRRLLQMKAIVEHTATHDGLTTLVNRDLFRIRLCAILKTGASCAVLVIDLDRFKYINDTMGHGAGDELLRGFSTRLLDVAGPLATVARLGGDEFAVLLPCDVAAMDLEDLCRCITEIARLPFALTRGSAYVSASIGVALASGLTADASEVMRKADVALYSAKTAGRNGYQLFNDDLDRQARESAAIEADLRLALQHEGQLELHYQPKVDVDNVVCGVEALLRWCHPGRGFIPPSEIIQVAEESGLIMPLGEWILREALTFAAKWPHLNVSVNVSPMQLRQPWFVAETLQAYRRSQVCYGRLELEVTETVLMDDIAVINGNLAKLRDAGIRIALDDFGTGYSSLRHLHRCVVDRVKIDKSFISGLGHSSEAAAITTAVIQLGHAVGLQVTAEGVETEAQRSFLVEAGIDELQGFLFSKPLDELCFAALMQVPRSHPLLEPACVYVGAADSLVE